MRERTPSADDTPKRAPPAPPREAASADVTGSKTSSEAAEAFGAAKFSPATTASSKTTAASSPSSVDASMVASTHNLDDLGVSHPASANSDRQQQQEKHGHTYRSAQTAQDKRSRLSNVINNLRKKVPDSKNGDSPRKEEDDRNSVERNLETLEKYVMTVLNGVIKDEEDDDREVSRKKETEKGKELEKLAEDQEDEDFNGPAAKFEPSKPNESRTEAAVFLSEQLDKPETKECSLERQKLDCRTDNSPRNEEFGRLGLKEAEESPTESISEEESLEIETVGDKDVHRNNKCSSKEAKPEEHSVQQVKSDGLEEEKKENRSLGTIIMDRLSESQSEDKGNVEAAKEDCKEFVPENVELRNVCRDLLNDLLSGINQLIDENSQNKEDTRMLDSSAEEPSLTRTQDFSMTSLHCSLPLDKVASVLQNCQTSELTAPQSPSSSSSSSQGSKSPSKPLSPTVRHLCLYCDRKFMSISLRQRHTERVHQQGGGRRSERNSRKPVQNCQYCSDKCAESLEGLFQHMVGSHGDKYHACLQCATRYLTREALAGHMSENHGVNVERNFQIQEKMKEPSPCKELGNQSPRERADPPSSKERRPEDTEHEHRAETILLKPMHPVKDNFSNPGSPEFDSSFYSSVSCNIRENLLHHLDGKLQSSSSSTVTTTGSSMVDAKPQQQPQQQSFYEHNQIQFPIDISLTAATPVYSKEYSSEEYENNSEYAQKPGKSNRSHHRRVSFEKYNFPRKYDGKEQWTCSIKDLSKFDISTQLSLRKKQQLLKEHLSLNRLHQITLLEPSELVQDEQNLSCRNLDEPGNTNEPLLVANSPDVDQTPGCETLKLAEKKADSYEAKSHQVTDFTLEFGNFLRLRKWDENTSMEAAKKQEVIYAELTGEWSRPRVYICGACASKHVTLKEMEEHKVLTHPNVWCSHFEFSGDQRELYKHLFLPGKDTPTAKARSAILVEKVCTKCSKNCSTLSELHRHMLECGGDQAWLLGLFGNGKKKCKWRPFGSRSRRRRQRGMKRNIQNSQTPRVNTPKEKQPTGPRVRPSDRESIQKMLANLPPKRATRKVLQDNTLRTQGRLRTVQTRTRPRMVGDNSSASRMSRNKAALRNKLLKNAKSIQRHRCRIDNISAVIESVVRNYSLEEKKSDDEKNGDGERTEVEKETKEKPMEKSSSVKEDGTADERANRTKMVRAPRVLGKKRNLKTKYGTMKSLDPAKKTRILKAKARAALKDPPEPRAEASSEATRVPKGMKTPVKNVEKEAEADGTEASPGEAKSPSLSAKNKPTAQTTPKRKRPVDPVASLNASLKAKSQLRTLDGKFARNPNKESLSPQKTPEGSISGRPITKGRSCETSPESSFTRSKLRTVSKCKNGDQLPKRTTRLSSDSDKMPTLEPAVQVTCSGEEFLETNDLPILSPATLGASPEKMLRGKSLVSKCLNLDDKNSPKKEENKESEGESGSSVQQDDKDQKPGKGRRSKGDAKSVDKMAENVATKTDGPKEGAKGVIKEKFKRKSVPARLLNVEEKRGRPKSPEEARKDARQKKEEGKLETRSNAKTKLERILDDDSPIKIQNVPFEVKKLIGSDSKDELLTKLVLTSRVSASKRCLRQPVPRFVSEQGKGKLRRDLDGERGKLDSGVTPEPTLKKEKFDARRKSLRNTDKRDKITSKDEKGVAVETDKVKVAVNEVKTAVRGRRSSSLSSESKCLTSSNQLSSSDGQTKSEVELAAQNTDKRQTRGSLLSSAEEDTQSEPAEVTLKKNTLGKRRGRIKSSNEALDKRNAEGSRVKSEEAEKNNSTELVDKVKSVQQGGTGSDDKVDALVEEIRESERQGGSEKGSKCERDQPRTDSSDKTEATKVNENLNHLQVETSNSMDSGKENTLERPAPVQKLKVGRPRKSWGPKKERASKRSLNNVIGILTEGMNIPQEAQQSVLSVQVTLTNVDPGEPPQSGFQQPDNEAVRSQNLDISKNTLEPSTNPDKRTHRVESTSEEELKQPGVSEESPTGNPNANKPEERAEKVEAPSKESKEQLPANDIILDLSRRKQKGKGSFLEKIVSKIAKQKDALLEGEVGSLLDTAADELTSILDEVGPGFPENTENPSEARDRAKAEKKEDKQTVEESVDETLQSVNLEEGETEVPNDVLSEESENNTDKSNLEEKVSNPEAPKSQDETLPKEDADILEVPSSEEGARTDASSPRIQEEETSPVPNEIQLPVVENVSMPSVIDTSDTLPKAGEGSPRKREEVVEERKVKRRSKKRSLEGKPLRKNKRKSVEPRNNSEENLISEDLYLADVMKQIEKSKQVPSIKETNSGKCKSLGTSDEPQTEDTAKTSEDSDVANKESKVDLEKDETEDAKAREEAEEPVQPVDMPKCKEEVETSKEKKNCLSLRISGKRKSCGEVPDQADYPIRRSYKRKSLQEEDNLSKMDLAEAKEHPQSVKGRRRRSFRTKSIAPPKTEEKTGKEIENDPVVSINNVAPAENLATPSPEAAKDATPEQTSSDNPEDSEVIPENSSVGNEETRVTDLGQIVENPSAIESEKVVENPAAMESEKAEEPPVIPKVPKKRGRKKKCLVDPSQAPCSQDSNCLESMTTCHLPPRRSLRTSRSSEEVEDQSKSFSSLTQVSPQQFKVPEVTEVLQHTKKRTYKRRSTADDNSDTQCSYPVAEPEVSSAECPELGKSSSEKEEQENPCEASPCEGRKRLSRSSTRKQSDLERSSSSGSIGLTQVNRTRSSRRKQFTSEDLSGQESLNQRAESADNLSETSCVSESSYFRKKRFSKRKKELQKTPENLQASVNESADAEKSADRRQSLNRRAKKNISFFAEFYLMDEFDISMDIQDCTSEKDTEGSSVSPRLEESAIVQDKLDEEASSTEACDEKPEEEVEKQDEELPEALKKFDIELEGEEVLKLDSLLQVQDEFQLSAEDKLADEASTEIFSQGPEEEATKPEEEVTEALEKFDAGFEEGAVDKEPKLPSEQDKLNNEDHSNETIGQHLEEDAVEHNEEVAEALKKFDMEVEEVAEEPEDKLTQEVDLNEIFHRETEDAKQDEELPEALKKYDIELEEDEDDEDELKLDMKLDSLLQSQDDFQTPKKRTAGNYVVVHKTTGEILIVEKRKKLTKEAAKFFCDVCTTSFTRKSSLKKHNQSQSHLIQMAKSKKDKSLGDCENLDDACSIGQNDVSSDENRSLTDEVTNVSMDGQKDSSEPIVHEKDLEPVQNDLCYSGPLQQDSLMTAQSTQHILEDELLDEEICKITENMSHEEYVLTDQVSPEPESTSTPIKMQTQKLEETGKKSARKHEKRKEKSKKKNLVDKQIVLDSPELQASSDSTLVTVLNPNMSVKITKVPQPNIPEPDTDKGTLDDSLVDPAASNVELRTDLQEVKEDDFQADCSDCDPRLKRAQDVNTEVEDALRTEINNIVEDDSIYKLDSEVKTENFPRVKLSDGDNEENQPHERLSLKFTINKRSIEASKEAEKNSFQVSYASTLGRESESCNPEEEYENVCDAQMEPLEQWSYSKLEIDEFDRDPSPNLPDNKESANLEELEASKVEDLAEESTKDTKLDEVADQQTPVIDDRVQHERQNEPAKRHGKSKRGRSRRHFEEVDNCSENRITKRSSKSKSSHNKVVLDDITEQTETMSNQRSLDPETLSINDKSDCSVSDPQLNNDSAKNSDDGDPEILETENENENDCHGLEIADDPEIRKFSEPVSLEELDNLDHLSSDERTESSEEKIESYHGMDDDEASSSSSLADKPLSQILLEREEKLEAYRRQLKEQESSTSKDPDDEQKPEKEPEMRNVLSEPTECDIDDNSSDPDELIGPRKLGDQKLIDEEQAELQVSSEEEYHEEASKTLRDCDKYSKISSESDNSEAMPPAKDVSNDTEPLEVIEPKVTSSSRKSGTSDRQSSSKKVSRGHKNCNKDSHKRSRSKKNSMRPEIAIPTSESDDSENEDKIESQNKSKIVKSVFGRVFGGEKVDKVKEVLNDWVSKSEDDSDASRTGFGSCSSNEAKVKDPSTDKNVKRHSVSSSIPSSPKKRSGKRSKKSSSSDRAKEKSLTYEHQSEHRKHARSKNSSNRKKYDVDASNGCFLFLPSTKCRLSKKRAEELISRTFEDDFFDSTMNKGQKSLKHREANYGLRNQGKPDLSIKDSGYGSFNYDEDSSKMGLLENSAEEDQKTIKRRKLSSSKKSKDKNEDTWKDRVTDKKAPKNSSSSEESFNKDLQERASRLSVDLESSHSCSSLAPSSVRNRSPSMDRNSQTTRDTDMDEDLGHRRMSPLFVCGSPRSYAGNSSNSSNEEEDENQGTNEIANRKRSSSEFSGEKIVIRSPSSSHKGEVVTIAPTDAIEDNALDVPQEIEATKPRQGKVLNFDEELFVECCSRLKATTENELRGAKKIKLDHNEGYHKKDDQQQGFRGPRDRWRDVESQNSLGSLLESVNQLLGEEVYSTRERDYPKRGSRNARSEHSSRSVSPDTSKVDNLGYEDSLDVAFEHNNKLRDKIQQRMRESESLIASTFGQRNSNDLVRGQHPSKNSERDVLRNSYSNLQGQRHLSSGNLSNGGYSDSVNVGGPQEEQGTGKMGLDPSGLKGKMNSSLDGLLDKALSNLLHSNEKHDHNGSTPMKVLAELACARAPTSTAGEQVSQEVVQPAKTLNKDSLPGASSLAVPKDVQKKSRNPIKELFERKKEMNERKQQERSKTEAALRELNAHRQRKTKKTKKHQDFPLIRRNEHGGLVERKKRRDGFERKEEFASDRIKDVYEFDEEESQIEPNLRSVLSYRSKPGYEVSCLKTKEVDVARLMSKAIGDSLENGKTGDALSTRLESIIDRKLKELEKFAPKTKGALKAFQGEEQQRHVTGPMDEFVERKQAKGKRTMEPSLKHSKLKKRTKNPKKKTRNAWYENDSSDEYRTVVKTEDVGVGISKSQRTCSKGKQNIFAELYTSSESEFEDEDVDYESRRQSKVQNSKLATELENMEQNEELINKYSSDNEDRADDWSNQSSKNDVTKHDCDNKKSESEMSDHPLVIDEKKDVDEQRNSDDETENQYERNYEMDDLYREDSSVVDSDAEEPVSTVAPKVPEEFKVKSPSLPREKTDSKANYIRENELIPLEEALDLLDQADNGSPLEANYDSINRTTQPVEHLNTVIAMEPEKETFDPVEEPVTKSPTPTEEQEEEPDNDLLALPEKLSTNEKPLKESENLPLHVFLSRKVQESKKRKEQQLKKMQEEQQRILMDFQPTRRQRKCAIGKQGLLAEISSSDEEISPRDRRVSEKSDHDKPRKQKRESKEKRKERYIEKKHEQMIAKEQKAIEEEILREIGKKKESFAQNTEDVKADVTDTKESENTEAVESKISQESTQKRKHQPKEKQRKQSKTDGDLCTKNSHEGLSDLENNYNKSTLMETSHESENNQEPSVKQKKHCKSPTKPKKTVKSEQKVTTGKRSRSSNVDKKNKTDSKGSKDKERRSSSGKRDSDDEELKTTKSWNKVEEGVGVAIGRRKRAAANQLYYWSSSSDEEEMLEVVPAVEEEEDDRQEQHGWIVGDSHKRMITMLAMEKQLKEKRRRSEDEFEPGRSKSKKHRNSTS